MYNSPFLFLHFILTSDAKKINKLSLSLHLRGVLPSVPLPADACAAYRKLTIKPARRPVISEIDTMPEMTIFGS